jgi:hypothetical protein
MYLCLKSNKIRSKVLLLPQKKKIATIKGISTIALGSAEPNPYVIAPPLIVS